MSAAPILIAEWEKSTQEVIRVSLDDFNGLKLLNLRIWFRVSASGKLCPTKAGITIAAHHCVKLSEAVGRALTLVSVKQPNEEAGHSG